MNPHATFEFRTGLSFQGVCHSTTRAFNLVPDTGFEPAMCYAQPAYKAGPFNHSGNPAKNVAGEPHSPLPPGAAQARLEYLLHDQRICSLPSRQQFGTPGGIRTHKICSLSAAHIPVLLRGYISLAGCLGVAPSRNEFGVRSARWCCSLFALAGAVGLAPT